MEENIYKVKVENIFEGPMDLLIHLIKKNEVDIYDIPVALITDQYLEYLELMKALNVDLAGDFLLMASTLAHIKSRLLLPSHGGEEDEEDPRTEITRPLLEYLKMKSAAEELSRRPILNEHTFARKPGKNDIPEENAEAYVHVGLFELVEAFKTILENASAEHRVDFYEDRITVKDRIAELLELLENRGSVAFPELFGPKPERILIVVTFLAVLEMVKLNLTRIVQSAQSGLIRLFYT